MSPKPLDLQDGAFLVSDAHYSSRRPELLALLECIQSKELQTTQLIFMGDIFDALFGSIPKSYEANQKVINIINAISQDIQVIYLEGNHDFNLSEIFPLVKVFTIQNQPVLFKKGTQNVLLAHGDFVESKLYKIYTALVRSSIMLFLMNLLNIVLNNRILNRLDDYLAKKKDCTQIKNFENIIENRLKNKYQCHYFLEGHFHQNKSIIFDNFYYINLAAFACNQRYFIVELSKEELLIEKIFSKEKCK